MVFFTSDIHIGDEKTLKVDARPFKSTSEYDKWTIKMWNTQATKNDIIYCLGDLFDCDNPADTGWKNYLTIPKKIKAKIFLIMGNNEDRIVKYFYNGNFEDFRSDCIKNGFVDVKENHTIELLGQKFFLTHEPHNHSKTMLSLFGHCHRAMGLYRPYGFCLSCDLNHFRLFSENDIADFLEITRKHWSKSIDFTTA